MLSTDEIKNKLSLMLPEKRFKHTLGVAEVAGTMADFYGIDREKTIVAALLHDCARGCSVDEMRLLASKTLFPDKYPNELEGKELYHAIASEVLAKDIFEVDDQVILSAIRWHTTGKRDMSDIEMIVYSADMIEPAREYNGVEELRSLEFSGLRLLTLKCCEHTVNYLKITGKQIHGSTMELYNWLNED